MSGKPYPEGIKKLSEQLRIIDGCREKINRLGEVMERQKKAIAETETIMDSANSEVTKLMSEMDLATPGNFGYGSRMYWALLELNKQAEEYGAEQARLNPPQEVK